MRIAFLVESAATGAGRHVLDLAGALSERGHSIHLIYSAAATDATFRARMQVLKPQLSGVPRLALRHAPHPTDALAIAGLRRYLRTHGPFDILHCHSTKAGFLGRIGLSRFAAATIYTPHAPLTMKADLSPAARFAMRTMEVVLSRRTNSIIAVCRQEADHLVHLGIDARRVFVVPNGVPPLAEGGELRGAGRLRLGVSDRDVVIGCVGRLETQKRVDVLLRALSQLPEGAREKIRLAIVGGGSLEIKLRALSRALGVDSRVIWTGEVDRAEAFMPGFDIFALTSDYEALPYVLLEALSAGLPVVTTGVGGAPTAVKHNHNGFLVHPGDVSGLARAITALVVEPALRFRMGEASKVISRNFSLDEMVRQTLAVYSNALGIASSDSSDVRHHAMTKQRQEVA